MTVTERLSSLAAELVERSVEALLVTAPANVRYLSGFSGSNGLLVVPAADRSGALGLDRPLFLTDFRYETQSEHEVGAVAPGCERQIATGDLIEALSALLAERQGAAPAGGRAKLGFDDRDLSVARHRRLTELLEEVNLQLAPCGGAVELLREVKDAREQEQIAAAAALADEALRETLERGLIGRTERQVAIDLEGRMRTLGAQGASFPTIVAAGVHGALPHAQPRDAEIRSGELVTIDWGATLDGYCSDCTRTYAAGEPSGRAREIYELVLAAQLAGLKALAPGRSGRAIDADARAVIERAGFGERFGHGLGHGVGIEVHEGPRLSKTASEEPLRAGTVVTVEPGVYLPSELGVRIEDLVILDRDGVRNLSSLPKDLTTVG